MKTMKSTKSTMGSKVSKSMSSKKPSLKKYAAGAIVEADDKDKGKGKKSTATKYMNRLDQGFSDLGSKIKSYIPKSVKDTYKKVEGAALNKLERMCAKDEEYCPYRKGGIVGKSRRK